MLIDEILSSFGSPSPSAIPEKIYKELKITNNFVIWGTGRAARYAIKSCEARHLVPKCVCDSFSHEAGETFMGLPLCISDILPVHYPNCVVLICCNAEFKIAEKLYAKGIPFLEWDTALLDNFVIGEPMDQVMQKFAEDIEYVYSLLADDKSKQTYENMFKYRLSLDKKYLQSVYNPEIYFNNDIVSNVDCNIFIDCGAYTGDTLECFINAPACRCKTYYALEPDPENYKILKKYANGKSFQINVLQVAVWNKQENLKFNARSLYDSYVSSEGNIVVKADSIDNIIPRKQTVGFIKMDVEGSEIQALNGAKDTIKRDCPIIAASIYHNKKDLWEIPLLLHRMEPKYHLYIRHHTLEYSDTVCYAIPK